MRNRVPRAVLAALCCTTSLLVAVPADAAPLDSPRLDAIGTGVAPAAGRLTNLDHIKWLGDRVTPPDQGGHTTYAIDEDPELDVLWTYADRQDDGTYNLVGGGAYDPVTDTWSQGAFNADDIARAAVVYLRDWTATGSASSRERAYQMLRGLTYLQTATGPNAGNVVLWMQPDGTLNPSAEPIELPDPSDSGPSYWLARTIWALGEGYAAFADDDPEFAAFLADRMDLSVDAVNRQVLDAYGTYLDIDGTEVPAWLIADGADASGEALLGLAPYVAATGDQTARVAMEQLAEGVAQMQGGQKRSWPFGAILPWTLSQAFWHAWGGLAPAGLASAAHELDDDALLAPALSDAASFTPHLLIATGAVNGWGPTPIDQTQIAYGADSRVGSLVAAAEASGKDGLLDLAGFAATWFFGNNNAGEPMYDQSTGRTYDGVSVDGVVNFNSGAESTIHGLLAMQALDANPAAAAIAKTAGRVDVDTWQLVEAETGRLRDGASVFTPESSWTGESQWSGGAGVELEAGGVLKLRSAAADDALVMPVILRDPDAGRTRWVRDGDYVGTVRHDRIGAQGDSPAPGLLSVRTLRNSEPTGDKITVRGRDTTTYVDAMLLQPRVEHLTLGEGTSGTVLVRSFDSELVTTTVAVPGEGLTTVTVYTSDGDVFSTDTATSDSVEMQLPRGGFALAVRLG